MEYKAYKKVAELLSYGDCFVHMTLEDSLKCSRHLPVQGAAPAVGIVLRTSELAGAPGTSTRAAALRAVTRVAASRGRSDSVYYWKISGFVLVCLCRRPISLPSAPSCPVYHPAAVRWRGKLGLRTPLSVSSSGAMFC